MTVTEEKTDDRQRRSATDRAEPDFPSLFRGRHEKAMYRDPVVEPFRGNPCIEALPEEISDKQLAPLLTNHITVMAAQRRLAPHYRDHYIEHIPRFYHPLAKAYQIHRQLQRMIRGGYVGMGRNPAELRFWDDIEELAKRMNLDVPSEMLLDPAVQPQSAYTGATAGSLIGVSGMGKSRTLKELLLKLFPQVIYHQEYGGRPMPFQQVVWLYLECPHNASLKSLLVQFFWAFDQIFGGQTNYYGGITRYGSVNADNLIVPMAQVGLAHALGLLVIDETQNINQASSGGAQRMLNLFVKLINLIGVPVLLVATPEGMNPLTAKFRMARRMSGQGYPKWDRMNRDDIDWEMFVKALWTHQYLRKLTPLTPELRHALYQASVGITEVAVRVFMFAQRHAIANARRPNEEKLTPELILSIPAIELNLMEPVLQALREGQEQEIDRVDDVKMETPPAILDEVAEFKPRLVGEPNANSQNSKEPKLMNKLLAARAEQPLQHSVYEQLKRAGFIRSLSEFM